MSNVATKSKEKTLESILDTKGVWKGKLVFFNHIGVITSRKKAIIRQVQTPTDIVRTIKFEGSGAIQDLDLFLATLEQEGMTVHLM
ncbi:hypothetical protein [Bacillus toyonensis]|uniref:hypothetical protein n=1 Tax=Bacillus toyonensis TaxID=155322 RepID=UPI000BF3ECE5|nr:hypothetical protein [Bacillus toyonensis]PGF05082.1 hypothetical protein COM61_01225 [Bacillus toyonensis]